jgi:hypothetical protein
VDVVEVARYSGGGSLSKRVETDIYRETLVRYIEENPVKANLVGRAIEYQFGSAFFRGDRRAPRWLSMSYALADSKPLSSDEYNEISFFIEGRLDSTDDDCRVDSMISDCPGRVFEWMTRRALLADSTEPGQPVCSPSSVLKAIELHQGEIEQFSLRPGPDAAALVRHMATGLIRTLCGARIRDIALVTQRTQSASASSWSRFSQLTKERAELALLAARIAETALKLGPFREFGLS